MTSPYANPGGFRCMYCGSQHSSRFDCRLPCSICQEPGPPYKLEKEDCSFDLAVFCFEHEPSKGWKIQPCSPPQITNVIFDMETSDPDDFLTLCWLCSHPKVNLIGVTVTPGTQEQIGLIRRTLYECHNRFISIGSFDLQRHPKGKMLHDPLAACVMMQPDICRFEEVEVYRSKGEWGSKKSQNTGTKISVSVNPLKFQETFLLLNMI